ncbi:DegV family protein [Schleiferilactobacillus perolens]|jgi:DegV family protein with EDD domain|uniref:EDD domain protein, DegV family n=1 Tax=Schleiferilactobacillus perolens DSM 12744 TaxID=1423792 RepID=A0A0R1N1C6_9LACO|nr:DegV family protein [Schleiferilactobacillus perolens]KRL14062.1 EDD domain protein, DegV family [Schleiferilactobacillus perolens DSM 12744]MCI1890760.1 DegV family protein [Schleiferilactobacillus harbinensis]MCI1912258.1 DegV family protein [Schleiferilactobacillus harbinensis]MCI2171915.1 DegV family protein [Schleiferilactobacillus perolens]
MKTAIVTDSTAYLTPEEAAAHHIIVVPQTIHWGENTYHDLVDISFTEFYDRLVTAPVQPTTSFPSLGEMEKVFKQLVKEGYDSVICLVISSGISSYAENLKAFGEHFDALRVVTYDSHITCAGLRYMDLLAATMVSQDNTIDEIVEALETMRARMGVRFMVDDLSHLRRTGRLSSVSATIGGLLKVKPILSMDIQDKGKIEAIAKERQAKKAYEHIKRDFAQAIEDVNYPVRVTVFDADEPKMKAEWVKDLTASFPQVHVDQSIIGPVIGVHTGKGAMAIIWTQDYHDLAQQYQK